MSQSTKIEIMTDGNTWKAIPLRNFIQIYKLLKEDNKAKEKIQRFYDKNLIELMDMILEDDKKVDAFKFHLILNSNQIESLKSYYFIPKSGDTNDTQISIFYQILSQMYYDYGDNIYTNFPDPRTPNYGGNAFSSRSSTYLLGDTNSITFSLAKNKTEQHSPYNIVLEGPFFMGYYVSQSKWGKDITFNDKNIDDLYAEPNEKNNAKNRFYNNPLCTLKNQVKLDGTTGQVDLNNNLENSSIGPAVFSKELDTATDLTKFLSNKNTSLKPFDTLNKDGALNPSPTSSTNNATNKVYLGVNGEWVANGYGDHDYEYVLPAQNCAPSYQVVTFPAVRYKGSINLDKGKYSLDENVYNEQNIDDIHLTNSDKKNDNDVKKYKYLFIAKDNWNQQEASIAAFFSTCVGKAPSDMKDIYRGNPLLTKYPGKEYPTIVPTLISPLTLLTEDEAKKNEKEIHNKMLEQIKNGQLPPELTNILTKKSGFGSTFGFGSINEQQNQDEFNKKILQYPHIFGFTILAKLTDAPSVATFAFTDKSSTTMTGPIDVKTGNYVDTTNYKNVYMIAISKIQYNGQFRPGATIYDENKLISLDTKNDIRIDYIWDAENIMPKSKKVGDYILQLSQKSSDGSSYQTLKPPDSEQQNDTLPHPLIVITDHEDIGVFEKHGLKSTEVGGHKDPDGSTHTEGLLSKLKLFTTGTASTTSPPPPPGKKGGKKKTSKLNKKGKSKKNRKKYKTQKNN